MSTNISNGVPFLRTQRLFPEESQPLSVEVDRAYTDIANATNVKTIGLFPENSPLQDGETWYFSGIKHQGLRQLYQFTAAGNIPHNINTSGITAFSRIYGTLTDGTNWYPLPYVDTVSSTNQVSVSVTPTNIVITVGGGSPPNITSGFVVLEWIVRS